MESGGTVALSANWLEPVNVMSNASVGGSVTTGSTITVSGSSWPYSNTTTTWYYQPAYSWTPARVLLKHGEVERLRSAAKRDAKLKAILQKFTPLIEVEVEF